MSEDARRCSSSIIAEKGVGTVSTPPHRVGLKLTDAVRPLMAAAPGIVIDRAQVGTVRSTVQ